jgi:NDP-sugar pyrophosphorylase family protein
MLENQDPIGVAVHAGPFFDLGTPQDLHSASMRALGERRDFEPREGFFDRHHQVLALDPPRASEFRRCVLGRVSIAEGARIEASVLWDGARVEEGAIAAGCLVGPVRLPAGRQFRDAFLWPGPDGEIREIPLHSHRRSPTVK